MILYTLIVVVTMVAVISSTYISKKVSYILWIMGMTNQQNYSNHIS